ncbi:hypothetical protein BJ912DRAFT_844203 [Pholiota molesta]|nr:hypothetical protein BJ912DRAFT_844203 [Pholiota molesta]
MPSHNTKHVRFAYKNVFHSAPVTPAMPPLTFSSSTDPSSLGVITPPSAFYPVPLPNKSYHAGSARPHPYLDIQGISWDMMDHPSTMSRNHHSISGRAWKEPATSPPLPSMSITIANFPWKFIVYASTHNYVTFEDVVGTIYMSLRKNIKETEFRTVASATDQRRATRAYQQRYRRQRSTALYEEEKRGGMKRVDFLMERTRFAGLSNTLRRADEWNLNIT